MTEALLPAYDAGGVTVYCGDALGVLRRLPDSTFQVCVTSPPYYNLRSYVGADHPNAASEIGREATLDAYLGSLVDLFREVRRVLRPDGLLWVVIGDCFARNPSKGVKFEASDSTYLRNRQAEEGNVGGGIPDGLRPKSLLMTPFRLALALQADGWYIRSVIPWLKRNVLPEPVQDRPTVGTEYVLMLSREERYFYDLDAVRKPHKTEYIQRRLSGPSPDVKSAVTIREDRSPSMWMRYDGVPMGNPAGRNRRNTDWWFESIDRMISEEEAILASLAEAKEGGPALSPEGEIVGFDVTPANSKDNHYAVFPADLIRPMIAASTSEGRACAACGAPRRRILGEPVSVDGRGSGNVDRKVEELVERSRINDHRGESVPWSPTMTPTLGWKPSCTCGTQETRPCAVLDCFHGSGTTAAVAHDMKLRYVGVDINENYIKASLRRFWQQLL